MQEQDTPVLWGKRGVVSPGTHGVVSPGKHGVVSPGKHDVVSLALPPSPRPPAP